MSSHCSAEDWPTLEKFAAECVLVVKAKQVGQFDGEGAWLTFKVVETWKGKFDPKQFKSVSPEGYIYATHGQHGVRLSGAGQEIIFFYTRHNQPPGKLDRHNTAFPINNGKIVYASTNHNLRREMSVKDFKAAVLAASKAK